MQVQVIVRQDSVEPQDYARVSESHEDSRFCLRIPKWLAVMPGAQGSHIGFLRS